MRLLTGLGKYVSNARGACEDVDRCLRDRFLQTPMLGTDRVETTLVRGWRPSSGMGRQWRRLWRWIPRRLRSANLVQMPDSVGEFFDDVTEHLLQSV